MVKKKRKISKKDIIIGAILVLIGLSCIGVYVYSLIQDNNTAEEAIETYESLKDKIVIGSNNSTVSGGDVDDEAVVDMASVKDKGGLIGSLQEKFVANVVGYIEYPEAGISYPIAQGPTNDTYLRTDLNGKKSSAGTLFLDCDNNAQFKDTGNIIYGHRMKAKTMFGKLESHIKNSGTGETFNVYTTDEVITYRVVSYGNIGADDRYNWLKLGESDVQVQNMANSINTLSEAHEDITGGRRFLTLITCHYIAGGKIRFGVTGMEIDRQPYNVNAEG